MPLFTPDELGNSLPVFESRNGRALARLLMRWLALDKVNDLYDRNICLKGQEFTSAVLEDLGVRYDILHPQVLDTLPDGPFIVVGNHPYGFLDGLMLVDVFARSRPDFKVMVNRILGRIRPLEDNFICVSPTLSSRTSPTSDSLHGIKTALAHVREGHPLGIFPSGAVSDLSLRERSIRDREWQEPVLRLIRRLDVPVVPVHFLDRNSDLYYSLGLIDWRVRLLRLPSEVFNKSGARTRIALGPVIDSSVLNGFDDMEQFGKYLRDTVYNLE